MKKDTPGEKGAAREKEKVKSKESQTQKLQAAILSYFRVSGQKRQISIRDQVKSPKTFGAVHWLACLETQLNS